MLTICVHCVTVKDNPARSPSLWPSQINHGKSLTFISQMRDGTRTTGNQAKGLFLMRVRNLPNPLWMRARREYFSTILLEQSNRWPETEESPRIHSDRGFARDGI